jgi:hypothetical protein
MFSTDPVTALPDRRLVVVLLCGCAAVVAQERKKPTSRPASAPTNLVSNGDFERPAPGGNLPEGWTTEHPDNVRLVDDPEGRGRVIEMTGDKKRMASYGVDLVSGDVPVQEGVPYRCTGYTRSTGPNMKVFVRGFATVTRRARGEVKVFDDAVYTMRKDVAPSERWQPFTLDFQIRPAEVVSDEPYPIKYVRIKLWAYWPVGTCWFDDIRFEQVGPRSTQEPATNK